MKQPKKIKNWHKAFGVIILIFVVFRIGQSITEKKNIKSSEERKFNFLDNPDKIAQ